MEKIMRLKIVFWLISIIILNSSIGLALEVKNLRVEYLKNPIGIDVSQPRLSWEIKSDERGITQSAYEIIVSTDKDGSNPIWNSGKVGSDRSVNNKYEGKALAPSTRYYWQVSIWDNHGRKCSSGETAFFETGLFNSGWGDAEWIKSTTLEQGEVNNQLDRLSIVDYSVSMDFEINQIAAGPCFGMTGTGDFYMWQFNIATDGKPENTVYFRPHRWENGRVSVMKEVEISDKIKIEKNRVYHLRIDITGNKATTYINGIELDIMDNPSGENFVCADLGFRASKSGAGIDEQAYFDNVKMTTLKEGTEIYLFEEEFSNTPFAFSEGQLIDGRLLMKGGDNDLYAWEKKINAYPIRFTLELDVNLQRDNAGIIFSAKDVNNMYMWSINTYDQDVPLVRRHIYENNQPAYSDSPFGEFYSKTDLIGKERHLKIDVENNIIKTYIDDILVDTFVDETNGLCNGFIGFRAYKGGDVDEVAIYDNVVLTSYLPNEDGIIEPVVTFSEDFENDGNAFENGETVIVSGNRKFKHYSNSGDSRVLQGNDGIPMFRKEFSIDKVVGSAKIYSSALGVYDLFINGKRVGTTFEDGKVIYDELKPGWTDYFKTAQYSTYDVTSYLLSGENAIGAQVASGWWKGGVSHGKYGSPDLSFIAKLVIQYTDGSVESMVTDRSWLTSNNGPIRMADIYNGETYDARKEMDWSKAGFDDSEWFQTMNYSGFQGELKAFAGTPVQVRPELVLDPVKTTIYNGSKANGSDYGEINKVKEIEGTGVIQLKKGETAIFDLGQNMVGWVRFNVKGERGTRMKLRFGEMLNDSGALSRGNDGPKGSIYTANLRSAKATLNYFLKGNEEEELYRPSLTFFGFRYCEVTATRDIEIVSLTGEVVGSVNEEGSSFITSSSDVNKLYRNVVWGQRGNFLSIPTDCPQRDERLGWTGDTQIFSKASAYNADVAAFFHKWMGDMRDSQREDGAYPDVAPHAWVGYGQGAWAEAGIIVPWIIYLMYDNLEIIRENYESMEKYMDFLAAQSGDGYLYNGAGTNYGDWVSYEPTDKRYISVCYYAYAAQLMAKMSKALSLQDDDFYSNKAEEYNTLYENIKAEFQERYIDQSGVLKEVSQTAYLLALKFDLFPSDVAKAKGLDYLVTRIADNGNKLSTGFVGTGILNQTLSENGANNTAYNLLLQRGNPSWLYSVDQGATTIWERWDSYTIEKGFQDVSMNSFNHYAYGAVSEWMFRFMAGIEPDESNPGFKHFILQPMLDNREALAKGQERITSVEAKYDSYYGEILSAWKIADNSSLTYTTTVPANTTATLYLPQASDDMVYEGLVLAKDADGVTFVKNENGKSIYELESGTYTFKMNVLTVDVREIEEPKEDFIYPNPVRSKLCIAKEPTNYTISNLGGTHLQSGKGEMVDVGYLPGGTYLIRVENEVYKFIKQ